MIALESNAGKGLDDASGDHGFVSKIIKLPNFGQSTNKPTGRMATVASGPVSS
jgi:hypothetical protein